MILYVKRLNSHVGSAETFNIPVTNAEEIPCGCVCGISAGGFLTTALTIGMPRYLTLEAKKNGDGKEHVSCVRLAPEMVLKGQTIDVTNIKFGAACSFVATADEMYTYVSDGGTDGEAIAFENGWITFILR